MDVNRLLYNHQLAKLNAQVARSHSDRELYLDLVDLYAGRIAAWRHAKGLVERGWPSRGAIEKEAASA